MFSIRADAEGERAEGRQDEDADKRKNFSKKKRRPFWRALIRLVQEINLDQGSHNALSL